MKDLKKAGKCFEEASKFSIKRKFALAGLFKSNLYLY
jgi:hypothetical protein